MMIPEIMANKKLQDVADLAGVSLTTASMALSGKGKISSEVSRKVKDSAKYIGYEQKRSVKRSNHQAFKYVVILHYENRPYLWNFSRPFVSELESLILRSGFYPIVMHVPPEIDTKDILQEIKLSKAGAVFAMNYVSEPLFDELESIGISVVIINNSNFQKKYFSVLVDDFQGAYEGTEYLIELGHRNIAYIEYLRPDMPAVIIDRFFGFRKAIATHKLVFEEAHRVSVELTDVEALTEAIKKLFAGFDKPTALFVHDDYYAAHVTEALKSLNMAIPRDVSLLAPGDVLDYKEPFLPKITTMRINPTHMVRTAWDLMTNILKTKPDEIQVLKVKQTLVDRGSCIPYTPAT